VTGALLLTGATGFLGMELLERYLERSSRRVFVLVRARSEREAAERLTQMLRESGLAPETYSERLVVLCGSVTEEGLGLEPRRIREVADEVTQIVHSAASVSFSLPLPRSRAVNVDGTLRLLELAQLCSEHGGLEGFAHVSTAYVCGTHKGDFGEDALDVGQGFRNPYERSKFEAELAVRAYADALPVQVFRPSIIVGDQSTGRTRSYNVLYWPLRAFAAGAYRVIPARRGAPVDVISVDYAADAIVELAGRPDGAGTHHLTAAADAPTVGELIDWAAAYFRRPPPQVVDPALYRRLMHPVLLRAMRGSRRRALQRSEVYFPYFDMDVHFDDARTRARLEPAGIRAAPLESYFNRIVDFAVETDWGRGPGQQLGPGRASFAAHHTSR
jgi:thioester reductase-like protein